jgi:fructose-1,6-bisphosphatase II
MLDGDVAGGIQAARAESRIDICLGVGGSPEGVVTACAIRALGGFMQGELVADTAEEKQSALAAGLELQRTYELDDLVASENTFFVATGVTDGALLKGVRRIGERLHTESIVIRGNSGTVRYVSAEHRAARWS